MSVPAAIVVPPDKAFVPLRTSVPGPPFSSPWEPAIVLEIVCVVLSLTTIAGTRPGYPRSGSTARVSVPPASV